MGTYFDHSHMSIANLAVPKPPSRRRQAAALARTAFKEKQSHADGKVADAKVVEGSLQAVWPT